MAALVCADVVCDGCGSVVQLHGMASEDAAIDHVVNELDWSDFGTWQFCPSCSKCFVVWSLSDRPRRQV